MSSLKLEPLGRTPADHRIRLLPNARSPNLNISLSPAGVSSLKLEPLGRTPAASTISYLDSGVVFVGSAFGDSQLIRCGSKRGDALPNRVPSRVQ